MVIVYDTSITVFSKFSKKVHVQNRSKQGKLQFRNKLKLERFETTYSIQANSNSTLTIEISKSTRDLLLNLKLNQIPV